MLIFTAQTDAGEKPAKLFCNRMISKFRLEHTIVNIYLVLKSYRVKNVIVIWCGNIVNPTTMRKYKQMPFVGLFPYVLLQILQINQTLSVHTHEFKQTDFQKYSRSAPSV